MRRNAGSDLLCPLEEKKLKEETVFFIGPVVTLPTVSINSYQNA